MANDRAATPLHLTNSQVSDFLKFFRGPPEQKQLLFKPTNAPELIAFVQLVTGKKPTGPTKMYPDQTWKQLVDALNDKLQEWRPEIKDKKKQNKVFKYDKTMFNISRMKAYEGPPIVDLIREFPSPSANNLPDPEPPTTEAPSARTPTTAPTLAPWAPSGASSTTRTTLATPQLETPSGEADTLASGDEILSGDEPEGLPDARPTPAAPTNAEEPASTEEQKFEKIQCHAIFEIQRLEALQHKKDHEIQRLEALQHKKDHEIQRLKRKIQRLKQKQESARCLAQSVLDDAGDSDTEQEDLDAGDSNAEQEDMEQQDDSAASASEPEQPVVPTSVRFLSPC